MNFGDILAKWEKQNTGIDYKNASYDRNETDDKGVLRGQRRSRLLRKKPEACIDLHGFNTGEAWTALEAFFDNSRKTGYEKVLIIHGKGDRQKNEGVLRELSKRFIESCSFAGESGCNPAREGGRGATWVILKDENRDYRSR